MSLECLDKHRFTLSSKIIKLIFFFKDFSLVMYFPHGFIEAIIMFTAGEGIFGHVGFGHPAV